MRYLNYFSILALLFAYPSHAFFGTEMGPLIQLVGGQLTEIQKLTESIGVTKDQTKMIRELNDGIEKTVHQIQSLQTIIERAEGLEPRGIQSLSDLNELLVRAQQTKGDIDELMEAKVGFADQAITQGALQSDTSYKMGQEMVVVGSGLAKESQQASPGRASQISAATGSAQMLAHGVELQTMAQMVQLQAMSLELQKSQVERDLKNEKARKALYTHQLGLGAKRVRP